MTAEALAWRVLRPTRGWRALDLRELWSYRELLGFLVWRDLKVRYKQTVLGVAWAVMQPLFLCIVFSIFFGRLAKLPSDGIPYPLFCLAGLVPWTFFASAVLASTHCLVDSANLIKKVYFPRLVIPLATAGAGLVDLVIALALLVVGQVCYGVAPGLALFWLPAFVLLAIVTALGVGFWLAALNAQYRDVRYTVPFLVQFWMFSTPIAYASSLLDGHWKTLYGLNPMAGVVEGFRWSLLGSTTAPGPMVGVSAFVAIALFASGLYYFRRLERKFADVL
ncbi:MAG: ABC transporter permease [Planctomycetota bacterium]